MPIGYQYEWGMFAPLFIESLLSLTHCRVMCEHSKCNVRLLLTLIVSLMSCMYMAVVADQKTHQCYYDAELYFQIFLADSTCIVHCTAVIKGNFLFKCCLERLAQGNISTKSGLQTLLESPRSNSLV